jgi:hypothetical protein
VDHQQDQLGGFGKSFLRLTLFADKTNGRPRALCSQDRSEGSEWPHALHLLQLLMDFLHIMCLAVPEGNENVLACLILNMNGANLYFPAN